MSRARSSTLDHLQRMAAATVFVAACNHGYAVVDPMPMPAKCQSVNPFKATAVWVKQGDGGTGLDLVVTVTKIDPTAGDITVLPASDIASITTDAQGSTVITIRVGPTRDSVLLVYNLVCAGGSDAREFGVYWSSPPVEGRVEHVSM